MQIGQIVNSLVVVVELTPCKELLNIVLDLLLFITTHHMGYYWSSSEISELYGKKIFRVSKLFSVKN